MRPDRAASRLAVRIRDEPAAAILGVAMAVWTAVFSFLVVLRHDRYRTIDFDLGIHDQAIWLLAHGQSFDTVRGLPVFGHHATFAFYLLVPFQWLGAGPELLERAAGHRHRLGRHPDLPPGPPAASSNSWWALGLGVGVAAAAAAAVLRLGDASTPR